MAHFDKKKLKRLGRDLYRTAFERPKGFLEIPVRRRVSERPHSNLGFQLKAKFNLFFKRHFRVFFMDAACNKT